MKLLTEVKKLKEKISSLKENVSQNNSTIKIINYKDFYSTIFYAVKHILEDYAMKLEDRDEEPDKIVEFKNIIVPKLYEDDSFFNSFVHDCEQKLKSNILWKFHNIRLTGMHSKVTDINTDNSKIVCKIKRMENGGSCYGAIQYSGKEYNSQSPEKNVDVLRFFYTSYNVSMYDNESLLDELNDESIKLENLDIDDFFHIYFPYGIQSYANLEFIIKNKRFSMDNIPEKAFEYISELPLYWRKYSPKLQEIGEELTEYKFEDSIKSQKIGRIISKL